MLKRLLVIGIAFLSLGACQFEWQETIGVTRSSSANTGSCRVMNNSGQGGWIQLSAVNVLTNGFVYRGYVDANATPVVGGGGFWFRPRVWNDRASSGWQIASNIYPGETYSIQILKDPLWTGDVSASMVTRIIDGNQVTISSNNLGGCNAT